MSADSEGSAKKGRKSIKPKTSIKGLAMELISGKPSKKISNIIHRPFSVQDKQNNVEHFMKNMGKVQFSKNGKCYQGDRGDAYSLGERIMAVENFANCFGHTTEQLIAFLMHK